MTKNELRKLILDDLEKVSNMNTKEYTLYKKWSQLNLEKNKNFYNKNRSSIRKIKKNIWKPYKLDDYKNLNVKVLPCNDEERVLYWNILRMFCSSAIWNGSPGRMGKYLVVNEIDDENADPFGFGIEQKKWEYLGIISLGSDFLSVGGRDKKIGWTSEQKFRGMLNFIAMGSTIVPTQPIGYNYVGGKLMSLLTVSDIVENDWNKKYPNEKLSGITTTSLYGGYSQYNGLKYWKKCKSTEGKWEIEPTETVYEIMRNWLRENYPAEYKKIVDEKTESGNVKSHPKTKILMKVKKIVGDIPVIHSNSSRGVYWCPLYENTENFLNENDEKLGNKRFDNKVESLVNLWKEKYAKKRIEKFTNNDLCDIIFYDDLFDISWEETKEKYL